MSEIIKKIESQKIDTLSLIIDKYVKKKNLTIIEFGRLRSLEDNFRIGDGWSTYQFAINTNVDIIYSIDNDERTIQHCKNAIPLEFEKKIIYLDSIDKIPDNIIFDFIYVDGPDDSIINLQFLEKTIKNINIGGSFGVDDYCFHIKSSEIEKKYGNTWNSIIIGDCIYFYKNE